MNPADATRILNAVPGVGPVTLNRLLAAFHGDAQAVLKADARRLEEVKGVGETLSALLRQADTFLDVEKEDRALKALDARWVQRGQDGFPALLNELPDPPGGLYLRGQSGVSQRAVAIVGTRRPTLYGRETAHKLAADLAKVGFWVVSGGARGIDTAAHQGALSVGGKTAVVLGCGLDIVYPPENLDLFRTVAQTGAIYTEFPIGRPADKQTFPQRNRLISGMTLATVVVESGARGGSMLTANFAAEQGRHVFAVPGRIDQESSRGCHALIREGATLLTGVDDILEALGDNGLFDFSPTPDASPSPKPALGELAPHEAAALAPLADGALRTADEIAEYSHLDVPACNAALLMLELKRRIKKHPDGRYEARGNI